MNKKLKFSWGHIIAFLALIVVSYVSFVGFTYLTDGNFTYALIGMGLTDIVYILFFIGAQQLKATDEKFGKKIIWERILIFGSPLVFVIGMVSMSHFWTVFNQNDDIVAKFNTSINGSKQLFVDYEEYANNRIAVYETNLTEIINNKAQNPDLYKQAQFSDSVVDKIQRDNMVETLKLQLLSSNFEALREQANEWIDRASHGAHTANVFLIGNTREIKSALNNWENQLKSFSAKEMTNEALTGEVAHFQSNGAQTAIAGINGLTTAFKTQKPPTAYAIIFGVILYLMLIFPYLIQERNTKTIIRLVGKEKEVKTPKKTPVRHSDASEATPVHNEEDDYMSF